MTQEELQKWKENNAAELGDVLDELDNLSKPEQTEQPKAQKKSKEENFAELRKSREQAEERLAKLEKEYQEKEQNWTKRQKELEEVVEKTAFERSDKFQSEYRAPVDQAKSELAQFAKEMTDDESLAAQILALKGREQIAFIEEKTGGGAVAAEMLRMAKQVERQENKMKEALDNYQNTKVALEVKERDQESRQRTDMERNFGDVVDRMSSKLSWFREGAEGRDDRINAAKAIAFNTAPQEDVLVAPFLAVITRDVLKENASLKAELKKYKSRVREDNSTEPTVRGGQDHEEDGTNNGKPMGMAEFVKNKFKR